MAKWSTRGIQKLQISIEMSMKLCQYLWNSDEILLISILLTRFFYAWSIPTLNLLVCYNFWVVDSIPKIIPPLKSFLVNNIVYFFVYKIIKMISF